MIDAHSAPYAVLGGGSEHPAFWAVALVVLFLLGDGVCALVTSPTIF
jgi:hypothetical protein